MRLKKFASISAGAALVAASVFSGSAAMANQTITRYRCKLHPFTADRVCSCLHHSQGDLHFQGIDHWSL